MGISEPPGLVITARITAKSWAAATIPIVHIAV
jgi:hypothetical protein